MGDHLFLFILFWPIFCKNDNSESNQLQFNNLKKKIIRIYDYEIGDMSFNQVIPFLEYGVFCFQANLKKLKL